MIGKRLFLAAVVAMVAAFAFACGDDDPTSTATQAPTQTGTGTATATGTGTSDVRGQFPADVQPLLAKLPDNLVTALWEVRQAGPDKIVMADGGGEYHEGKRRAFMENWEKITGWTVESAPQTSGGWPPDFDTKVAEGNSPWDIVLGGGDDVTRAVAKNLLQELDFSAFPELPEAYITQYGINTNDGDTPLIYNTSAFPDPATAPKNVTDIFDAQNFPGKRCLFEFPPAVGLGSLEYALMADGVPADQIFELMATKEGRDRAYAKLDTIKEDIVWVESGANSVQFILDGQCDLGITWNGRPALRLKDEPNLPIAVVHEGAGVWQNIYTIPVGAKNYDASISLMVYWMQPESQCGMLNNLAYGLTALADPACLTDFAEQFGPLPQPAFSWRESTDMLAEIASEAGDEWAAWKTGG